MQIQDFKPGDTIQWLQKFEELEAPITGIVEVVALDVLTVRDNLGQFWQVTAEDSPTSWDNC
jgi:hypothetical protein